MLEVGSTASIPGSALAVPEVSSPVLYAVVAGATTAAEIGLAVAAPARAGTQWTRWPPSPMRCWPGWCRAGHASWSQHHRAGARPERRPPWPSSTAYRTTQHKSGPRPLPRLSATRDSALAHRPAPRRPNVAGPDRSTPSAPESPVPKLVRAGTSQAPIWSWWSPATPRRDGTPAALRAVACPMCLSNALAHDSVSLHQPRPHVGSRPRRDGQEVRHSSAPMQRCAESGATGHKLAVHERSGDRSAAGRA